MFETCSIVYTHSLSMFCEFVYMDEMLLHTYVNGFFSGLTNKYEKLICYDCDEVMFFLCYLLDLIIFFPFL